MQIDNTFASCYRGKRVFVTGHSGFVGSWLSEYLLLLGVKEITGYSLPAATEPALSNQLELPGRIRHLVADVRDRPRLESELLAAAPDFVFHLAAQPIVRESFLTPVETWSANVMGTLHLLDALRRLEHPCAVVIITSDKCYENCEWVFGYREEDSLGGFDPYSSSKGAMEIGVSSWRRSFFSDSQVRIATARAGNLIGGGDYAKDRIVPDCVRALQAGKSIPVRNRTGVRPWQHVMECVSGYCWLGAVLSRPDLMPFASKLYESAWNFGPGHDANKTVENLVVEVLKHWPGQWEDRSDPNAPHEARLLQLSTDKANALLGWSPVWTFSETIKHTIHWYREASRDAEPQAIRELTDTQIAAYTSQARSAALPWATSV